MNSKGYKVLNNVRVIQGDGIGPEDVITILQAVVDLGYSAENVNFGMGGGLLQKGLDRDTHKFAFKCSWIVKEDGTEVEVFKDPITDPGKVSKKGRLAVETKVNLHKGINGVTYVRTVPETDNLKNHENLLNTVFLNGELVGEQYFETIRLTADTCEFENWGE